MLDVVSSISLSSFYLFFVLVLDKLLGDIGLQLICQYLSYNRYPNLSEINFQDNLLTDSSLNTLSSLIASNKCYKLRLLNLTCNYINVSVGQLFVEFCSQHHITVQLGGCPNFELSTAVSASFPPTLFYRVVVQSDETSCSSDSLLYSNFCKAEEWCSMGQKPIVGVQLFYYGMGRIATQVVDIQGNRTFGNGECGNVVVSAGLAPIASVEFGCKDTPFSIVSYGSTDKAMLVSLKLCLVANSYVCLFKDCFHFSRFSCSVRITSSRAFAHFQMSFIRCIQNVFVLLCRERPRIEVSVHEIDGTPYFQISEYIIGMSDLRKYRKACIANSKFIYYAELVLSSGVVNI